MKIGMILAFLGILLFANLIYLGIRQKIEGVEAFFALIIGMASFVGGVMILINQYILKHTLIE